MNRSPSKDFNTRNYNQSSNADKRTMTKLTINDSIAETLLIPLYGRALESQKPDPLIHDPYAVALVQALDYDFEKFNHPSSTVGCALRAAYFDDRARIFIATHPDAVVVNVGCGLDARLQRLGDIANDTPFYGLDLDEVINLRHQWLKPLPNEVLIGASMFDPQWLDDLADKYANRPILFIIEGVMMYFDKADNQKFFCMVAERFKNAHIYLDSPNVFFSKRSSRHRTVSKTSATFKFGMDDPKEIETWGSGWNYIEHRYFSEYKKEVWRMGKVIGFLTTYIPIFKTSFFMAGYKNAK